MRKVGLFVFALFVAAILSLPNFSAYAADEAEEVSCSLSIAEQNVNLIMVQYNGTAEAQVHWPFDNGGAIWSDGESKAVALSYDGGPNQTITAQIGDVVCATIDVTVTDWLPPTDNGGGNNPSVPSGVVLPSQPVEPGSKAWQFMDMTITVVENKVCITANLIGQLPKYPVKFVFGGFDNSSDFPVRDGNTISACHDYDMADLDAGILITLVPVPLGDYAPALSARVDSTMSEVFASNYGGSYQTLK